jgi:hypothetical protein
MKARLLLRERWVMGESAFADIVIWQLPRRIPGSRHTYKYRLAFVVDEMCVLRFDNESGKGDHKHVGGREAPYVFTSLERLVTDFLNEIDKWSPP